MVSLRLVPGLEVADDIPIVMRGPSATDIPFLFSSWLRSYRDEADNRHMASDVYYARVRPRITTALRQLILLAHNPDDATQIYGWVCYRPGAIVHYVYVKYTFRHLGVARRLIALATGGTRPIIATHTGRCFDDAKRRYGVQYDPNQLEMP